MFHYFWRIPLDWAGCLFFTDAKRAQAEITRRKATEGLDWQTVYQDEIVLLQRKIKEIEKERDEMTDIADQAEKDRDHYVAENDGLRWQVESLRRRLCPFGRAA